MEHFYSLLNGGHVMALIICLTLFLAFCLILRTIRKESDGTYAEKKALAQLRVNKAEALQKREMQNLPSLEHKK